MFDAVIPIGPLALSVGRRPATIRLYEKKGIIPRANRDPISGRRFWTQAQAELIRRRLQPIAVSPCPEMEPQPTGRGAMGAAGGSTEGEADDAVD